MDLSKMNGRFFLKDRDEMLLRIYSLICFWFFLESEKLWKETERRNGKIIDGWSNWNLKNNGMFS
jgi:hypothetical protein